MSGFNKPNDANDITSAQGMLDASGPGPDPTVDNAYFPDPMDGGAQPDAGSALGNARKLLAEQSPDEERAGDARAAPDDLSFAIDADRHDAPERANSKEPPERRGLDLANNPEGWAREQQMIDSDVDHLTDERGTAQ